MELAEYYKIMEPEDNSRVLVTGKKAIPIALYLAGKSRKNSRNVKTHALISEESKVRDITEEIYIVKEKFPEHLESIENGITRTTFEKTEFERFTTKTKYDYLIYYSDHLEKQDLEKITYLKPKKTLLHIPLKYSMALEIKKKRMFSKKTEIKTLKQLLKQNGAQIEKYEADKKTLIVIMKGLKKDFDVKSADLKKTGEKIIKEVEKYFRYTKNGAEFAVKTKDKEFLLYVRTKGVLNKQLQYNFTFLNGRISIPSGPTIRRSKQFEIIVLPNTKVFEDELNSKDILILSKQKAVEVFQETYIPM